MDLVMSVISYFKDNGTELALLVTSIIGTASIVVKLTPSTRDDAILAKIKAFVGKWIALN